jgi:bifunctional non-homologous end joining protein LigD
VGALLIGVYEKKELRWAGKVGTGVGWNAEYLRDLRARLEALPAPASPFTPPVSDPWLRKNAHWVRPELVIEVTFSEWTTDGHVRHPSAQGLRSDKAPFDVMHEEPAQVQSNPKGSRDRGL